MFSDGYAKVLRTEREMDEYGYYTGRNIRYINLVDTEGNLAWEEPSVFRSIAWQEVFYSLSDGLVVYYDSETGLFGYRDINGQVVIPAQFRVAEPFHEGLAKVYLPDDYINICFIDQTGNIVFGPLDGDAGYYSNGLLNYVGYLDAEKDIYFAGYLDRQGQPAITIYQGDSRNNYSTDEYLEVVGGIDYGTFSEDGYAVLYDYRGAGPIRLSWSSTPAGRRCTSLTCPHRPTMRG